MPPSRESRSDRRRGVEACSPPPTPRGRRDVALPLAESIGIRSCSKRATARRLGTPPVHPAPTGCAGGRPPDAWPAWARGWSFAKTVSASSSPSAWNGRGSRSPARRPRRPGDRSPREIRIAPVEADSSLRQVPSQVDGVPATIEGGDAAPRPGRRRQRRAGIVPGFLRQSGRRVAGLRHRPPLEGEGYGLEIASHHYVAHLSRQMGQFERLISRREHGLELYAGGKGHGEPPGIDWAHDY